MRTLLRSAIVICFAAALIAQPSGVSPSGTRTQRIWLPAAGCVGTTPVSFWDLPVSNPAVSACATGTNTQAGVLGFADGSDTVSAQNSLSLPAEWVGSVSASIRWTSTTTSGNVVWAISSTCVAQGETGDPAWNAADTVTSAAPASSGLYRIATVSSMTMTGCSAGEMLMIKVSRDPTATSDTMAGTANLVGVEVMIRRRS